MEHKTAMQDLLEKATSMIEDNKDKKSQFHKGFLHGMGMVKDAIEIILLSLEKQQIIDAANNCLLDQTGEDYYNKTYIQ